MSDITIGIDIGISGSIVILVNGEIDSLHITPVFKVDTIKNNKKKTTNHLDVPAIIKILQPLFVNDKPQVFIEEVTHLFGLPSTSNFKLGYSAGIIHGIMQTLGDFYLVGPKKWQQIWEESDRVYMLNKDGTEKMVKRGKGEGRKLNTKATSLKCARRLYPDHDLIAPGGRVPHDGCIDALLIATYGEAL